MTDSGFQRLVLLGSAGYQRAELPLDDSVSLIAPNNTGKTSLINALQFLLIIDQRRMDFGAHPLDKTRRFYFPNNSAYILLEVTVPESGTLVLGCVGKGVSHDYEYFVYQGILDVDGFRLPDGTLVPQPRLKEHLAQQDKLVFSYSPKAFSEQLYGGRRNRSGRHDPDFTVFRLEHGSDAAVFQRVLTRTLRLDRLTSAEVKNYLLQIFRRDLPDASVDFKQEWDKAFSEVNAERAQYLAAVGQVKAIDEGNARQGLKVADLFRLVFVVGKRDAPAESFDDIDCAASNGTVLMAKLITGLAMLHLMQDQRRKVRGVCYLDEALALDARNQKSLIDTAGEFGFALIFASPAPLTTVRYCVPIQQHDGWNHISRRAWQVLESLDEVPP